MKQQLGVSAIKPPFSGPAPLTFSAALVYMDLLWPQALIMQHWKLDKMPRLSGYGGIFCISSALIFQQQ
jgi:hypothetical protein